MVCQASSVFTTRTRSVALVFCYIGCFLYFVAVVTPSWLTYTHDTVTLTVGLYLTCVGNSFSDCTTVMDKDEMFKVSQICGTAGFITYFVFAISATLTFFWTKHWKKLKRIKLSAGIASLISGVLISIAILTILQSNTPDNSTMNFGGYLGLVSIVISMVSSPFYIIDSFNTTKQMKKPRDHRQKRWDRTEPITSIAPEPTFILDRCPTYVSRFDEEDRKEIPTSTRSPLIDKILTKPTKNKKTAKKENKDESVRANEVELDIERDVKQNMTKKSERLEKSDEDTIVELESSKIKTDSNTTKPITESTMVSSVGRETENTVVSSVGREIGKVTDETKIQFKSEKVDDVTQYDEITEVVPGDISCQPELQNNNVSHDVHKKSKKNKKMKKQKEKELSHDKTEIDSKSDSVKEMAPKLEYTMKLSPADLFIETEEDIDSLDVQNNSNKKKKKKKKKKKQKEKELPQDKAQIESDTVKEMSNKLQYAMKLSPADLLHEPGKDVDSQDVQKNSKKTKKIKKQKEDELPHFFKEYIEERDSDGEPTNTDLNYDFLLQETAQVERREEEEEKENPKQLVVNKSQARVVSAKFRMKSKQKNA